MKDKIFTLEFLNEIGFTLIPKNDEETNFGQYGSAKDRTGMTIIHWNKEGASCTYFAEKLDPNNFLLIEKDGGTRTAFNGYVFNQDDVRKLLKLTW
jgi:hypothetical protein